ncbi:MAG: sensor histidine kinase [Magnetospirillum sp.]|nr:sensor histidine kinase [Magnetospirillum sp.]
MIHNDPSPPAVRAPEGLRRSLLIVAAVIAATVLAAAVALLSYMRHQMIADAQVQAGNTALLLEQHVTRTFRATDFVLGQVVDLARSMPIADLPASQAAARRLKELQNGLPETGTLWIIDAAGRVVLGTVPRPGGAVDVADRYYFQAHLDRRHDLVVGPLVRSKTQAAEVFHLSRRIDGPDGGLRGVAAVGISVRNFTDFYRTLAIGPGGSVGILDGEGRVILRQPDNGGPVTTAAAIRPEGVGRARSAVDGVERIFAYRRLPDLGVTVVCTVSVSDVLAPWWVAVAVALAAILGVMAVLGWTTVVALRAIAREEAAVERMANTIRIRTREAEDKAEEARRANETKSRFLAAASHDLRQPIQAAGMFAEVLAVRLADTPYVAVVDKLRHSIDSTQALLATLLDVSILEAGKIEPIVAAVPIAPLLASLADQMQPEAQERGLRLDVIAAGATVLSDPVLLERMLRNLVVNALRYTTSGGVAIGCRRRGAWVGIAVVDTGCGIAAGKEEVIFDDFTRLGEKGNGLGLGLGVVKRTAALLGHGIEVRSQPGRGSTFTVLVPLAGPAAWPRAGD